MDERDRLITLLHHSQMEVEALLKSIKHKAKNNIEPATEAPAGEAAK